MPTGHCLSTGTRKNYAQSVVAGIPLSAQDRCVKNLRHIRTQRGLTQTQLAEAAGCNQAAIAKIEKGGKNVTLDLAGRIAAALNVPVVDLFGVSEIEQRYLNAFRAASPARQRAVLVLLEGDSESAPE